MKRQCVSAPDLLPRLPALFMQRARESPDAVCIDTVGGLPPPLTYGMVAEKAGRTCKRLQAAGVQRGDFVGVCVSEGWEMVVVQLAVLMAQAAFAPIDLSLPTKRVVSMLSQVRPKSVIISESACQETKMQVALSLAAEEGSPEAQSPPSILKVEILLQEEDAAEGSGEPVREEDDDGCGGEGEGGGACWVYFTSGTSGMPKGVVCCHDGASNYCLHHPLLPPVPERGQAVRILLASAFTFDPSAGDTFSALSFGCVLVLASRQALLSDLPGVIKHGRVTHVCSTPAVWGSMAWNEGLASLQVVGLGGEKMSSGIVDEWAHRVRLVNVWGTTEGTVYQTSRIISCGGNGAVIGDAVGGMVVRLEGEGGDEIEEGGGEGEIVVGGPQVALGYLNDEKGGFERRGGIRWYRSGDLGEKREGQIHFLGRRDAQVKVNGERVELEEVESVLRLCPLVQAAAARPSASGKTLDAYLVLTPTGALSPDTSIVAAELYARSVLSRGWCPATYTILPNTLPLTPSGKLDRTSLPPPDASKLGGRPPRGELQLRIARIWEEVLGIERDLLSQDSDFIALGGDSLSALTVSKRLLSLQHERGLGAGEVWPADGVVVGPLGAKFVLDVPGLRDFAAHLVTSGSFPSDTPDITPENVHEGSGLPSPMEEGLVGEGSGHPSWFLKGVRALYREAGGQGGGDMIKCLVGCGLPVEGVGAGRGGWLTPLHVAANSGNTDAATALLLCGAKVTAVSPLQANPAHLASAASNKEVLSLLLSAGAPIRARDLNKQTLLHYAARAGAKDCASFLLASGATADISAADKWNRTPLHWAILNGHADLVSLLVEHGAPALPRQVPARVHKRRTTLVSETPEELARRLENEGGGGEILAILLAAAGRPGNR